MRYWRAAELDGLPREGIFILRGSNPNRLETFVDAAFAFAVTLLVISIDNIPSSYDEFVAALLQTPAFIGCFFQLMMFWLGHRAWSRRYGMDGKAELWVSLVLVAGILVIVYPLRLMIGAALAFISDGLLPAQINFSFDQLRTVFILYSSGFGLLSLTIALLFWLALQAKDALLLSPAEIVATRSNVQAWLILSGTGIVSIAIAILAEGMAMIWAGWIYVTLAVIMPLHGLMARKRLVQLMENHVEPNQANDQL
jgi:hypothetical protein